MLARKQVARGFTLVEILIVVVILGILAAIVIPQFTNASETAKASSLAAQLQTIRSQLEPLESRLVIDSGSQTLQMHPSKLVLGFFFSTVS